MAVYREGVSSLTEARHDGTMTTVWRKETILLEVTQRHMRKPVCCVKSLDLSVAVAFRYP